MVRYYVDSNATGGDDTGLTGPNAWLTFDQAVGVQAGDDIAIAHNHAESFTVVKSWTFANSSYWNPVSIISRNLADDSIQIGASLTSTTPNDTFTLTGNLYVQGMTFAPEDFMNTNVSGSTNYRCQFVDCTYSHGGTDGSRAFQWGSSTAADNVGPHCIYTNCTFNPEVNDIRPRAVILIQFVGCTFNLEAATGFSLLVFNGACMSLEACNLAGDLTPTTLFVFDATEHFGHVYLNFCNLPSDTITTSNEDGSDYQFLYIDNSDSGTITNAPIGLTYQEDPYGLIEKDIAFYIDATSEDANDEEHSSGHSWAMTKSANGSFTSPMFSPPMSTWVDGGTEVTCKVEFATFPEAFDDDVWIEWQTIDETAAPNAKALNIFDGTDRLNSPNGTPASHTATSASWAGGMLVANRGLSSVTFTPTNAGFVIARAYVGTTAAVIYVNPHIEVT